jgi:DNA-binding HxlR family transcriptional regulator
MFGDKWSLLIVRDVVFAGKQTFNDFLRSDEGIARNILADRLIQLEEKNILFKQPHPTDGRKDLYTLTEKGLGLIPVLISMAAWGGKYEMRTHVRPLDPNITFLNQDNNIRI